MIKCLLTKFSWAERENIGLSAIKQGPRCAPTTQSRKAQYFRFVQYNLSKFLSSNGNLFLHGN